MRALKNSRAFQKQSWGEKKILWKRKLTSNGEKKIKEYTFDKTKMKKKSNVKYIKENHQKKSL